MKPVIIIFLFIGHSHVFSQTNQSDLSTRARAWEDSISNIASRQLLKDSLKINEWSSSLKQKIEHRFDADSLNAVTRVDSLGISQASSKLNTKLDSLRAKRARLNAEVDQKRSEVVGRTKTKLENWKNAAAEKFPVDHPTIKKGVPNNKLRADLSLSGLPVGDFPELPQLDVPALKEIDLSPDLSEFNMTLSFDKFNQLDDIGDMSKKLSRLKEKVLDLKDQTLALSELQQNPDKLVENKITELTQVDGVKKELARAEAINNNELLEAAEKLNDAQALKEEAKQMVVEKAVNHFDGKEQVLHQAMDKIAKYKAKYERVNSLAELKKRPPNPMKGKPLIERFVPGIAFQVLRNRDLLVDINPYFGYRLTGRLTFGPGWNQRIGYSTSNHYFTSGKVVYGPRFYADYKIWKGFFIRLEEELMNTFVPPNLSNTDNGRREWVFSTMLGIKSEYRIMRYIKGTAFVKFNLFNPEHKSPYADVVNSRFGVEFMMKKRPEKVN